MKIGIQISLGSKQQTGIREYASQLVKHLMMLEQSKEHQFFLYSPKVLKWPFRIGWTQIRLSWEMLKNKVDVLFVPAHTFPLICPKKLIVTIQGLEFEAMPKMYSFWQRVRLRFLTKRNIKKATRVIVPSENTKKDLLKFYPRLFKRDENKIFVIPHGIIRIVRPRRIGLGSKNCSKYILYLGSNHKRKNVKGLEEAFEILKNKYSITHKLILAGTKEYLNEEKKWKLLREADVFVFPSLYEGFGFPVLEAQSAGVPVVTSNVSSLPEIVQDPSSRGASSALLVTPDNPKEIAKAIYKLIINDKLRKEMIERGYKNIKRFSWHKCAEETLKIIT